MPAPRVIRLCVPGKLHYRDVALRTVASVCKLVGSDQLHALDDQEIAKPDELAKLDLADEFDAQMVSAFSEVFNNIALHGYSDGEGDIDIEMELARNQLVVRVKDQGTSIDMSQIESPDLDQMPESGLGMFIVESCVDEFTYQPGPPNVWILKKSRADGRSADQPPDGDSIE